MKKQNSTLLVTKVLLPKGTAFATRTETGEEVFIPPRVSRAANLEDGDVVDAILVENSSPPDRADREPVRWLATYVAPIDGKTALTDAHSVSEGLSAFDYPVTAAEAGLDLPSLEQAHKMEKAVKIVVSEHPSKPKVVMWAATMDQI